MRYEGCDASAPNQASCTYGSETNEQTLTLVFSTEGGKLGKLIDAKYDSEI